MVKKSFLPLFGAVTLLVILADQLTKYIVLLKQPQINAFFLTIHLVYNTGAGFGILQNNTTALAIISAIVALIIISTYKKIPNHHEAQIFVALFLGGTFGNLLDRVFRKVVIDFIDLAFWPAFNIADLAITIGALGLVIYFWKNEK
ncbi:MAG: signal peptidase II [archaeon]|nr:signal peptidase II [archaeon]